ncbi:biotin carboxylase [Planomicrobium soli]|uniref:Biotin carboxylase n=1 Tax=Planomicrobium soli TaxID=1176648 RepID=A0A2P8GQV2_9BACL|nr:hypothetical protein [Planomicrobium soli]PSL36337.1 biotin carboxylase [Planomicrobium soli]
MSQVEKKRILFLSGITQMIDVIRTAKNSGYYTIVTDRTPGSPAKTHADKFYDVSTSDTEKLAEIARAEKVDGVFNAFDDVNTWNALALCEELNLPYYATAEQLEICSDKGKFKEWCRNYSVPVIEEYKIDGDLSEEFLSALEFPVIIKPVDSYASQGITVCYGKSEARAGYTKALRFSKSKKAIIERFIDNAYGIQILYTIQNNNIILNAVVDRFVHKHFKEHPPLPIAMVFPSQHREQYIKEVDSKVRTMLKGMGIKNGVIFIQSLYENDSFYIYEMGFRLGGSQLYSIIEKQTGINQVEMMLDLLTGRSLEKYDMSMFDNAYTPYPSCNLPILLNEGTIGKIVGLEKIPQMPAVISCITYNSAGDKIAVTGSYTQMFGRITIVAASEAELNETIAIIQETLKVLSTDGEDMIIAKYHPIQVET